MSIFLPPTLAEINEAISRETIIPGAISLSDGVSMAHLSSSTAGQIDVHTDATKGTLGTLQAGKLDVAAGTIQSEASRAMAFVADNGGHYFDFRGRGIELNPQSGLPRIEFGNISSSATPYVQQVTDGIGVYKNDDTLGAFQAGQISLAKSASSDSDDFVTVNNGVRDIFSLKSRDGAVLNVGASRYLDISRDSVQSLRLGNFSGVPHIVTADGLRLLVGARQSTAADCCVGIYNDVEPEASTPLVKFGYGLNGPNTESAKLMADGTFHATQVVSVGLKLTGLPTSDPGVQGQVWQDGTDLQISAG